MTEDEKVIAVARSSMFRCWQVKREKNLSLMTHGRRFSSSRRLMAPFSTTFTRRSQAQVSCRQIIKLLRNYFLRILGPPALIASSASPEGLLQYNRPIYNYIMRGVVTAFTGIRKRDELTQSWVLEAWIRTLHDLKNLRGMSRSFHRIPRTQTHNHGWAAEGLQRQKNGERRWNVYT